MAASAQPKRSTKTRAPDAQARRVPEPSASPEVQEVTVHEAKTHLSRLLAQVEEGRSVVITRRGKPVAKLEPMSATGKRIPGSMRGLISIDERFFEPLPEDELRAWEGG